MSRFCDFDWDGDGMPPGLWHSVIRRTMESPRGQKFLRELEAALVALPQKSLVTGVLVAEGQCCALGALALYRVRNGGLTLRTGKELRTLLTEEELEQSVKHLVDEWETQDFGEQMGMARSLAWKIAWINDEGCEGLTDTERYEKMLSFVRGKIKPKPVV